MTNVEFFVDGVKVAEDATAPFSGTWSAVTGGSHRLTAVGWADTGITNGDELAQWQARGLGTAVIGSESMSA